MFELCRIAAKFNYRMYVDLFCVAELGLWVSIYLIFF